MICWQCATALHAFYRIMLKRNVTIYIGLKNSVCNTFITTALQYQCVLKFHNSQDLSQVFLVSWCLHLYCTIIALRCKNRSFLVWKLVKMYLQTCRTYTVKQNALHLYLIRSIYTKWFIIIHVEFFKALFNQNFLLTT